MITRNTIVTIEEFAYSVDRWYIWHAKRAGVYAEGRAETFRGAAKAARRALERPESVAWYPQAVS